MSEHKNAFLQRNQRIVRNLYEGQNVAVPVNSGDSLFHAAQKILEIGFDEYTRLYKEKEEARAGVVEDD